MRVTTFSIQQLIFHEALMDGCLDGWTNVQYETIIPSHYQVAGYKKHNMKLSTVFVNNKEKTPYVE